MIKTTLTLASAMLCMLALPDRLNAQTTPAVKTKKDQGAYFRLGVGYGFAHGSQTSIFNDPVSGGSFAINGSMTNAVNSSAISVKNGSFGAGVAVTLAGGYMLSKHVGVELAAQASVLPKEYTFESTSNNIGGGGNYTSTTVSKAMFPVYAIPAIMLTTGNEGLTMYTRIGLTIPLSNKISIKEDFTSNSSTGSTEIEVRERFSLGYQAALGVNIPITGQLNFWVEASGLSRNANTKEAEILTYMINGVDMLDELDINKIEYEYDYTAPNSSQAPTSKVQKGSVSSIPHSNIGLNLGLTLRL